MNYKVAPVLVEPSTMNTTLANRIVRILDEIEYSRRMSAKVQAPARFVPEGGFSNEFISEHEPLEILFTMLLPDANGGSIMPIHFGTAYLHPESTDDEIVELIYRSVIDFECHECAENFRYKGAKPFDPHANERAA